MKPISPRIENVEIYINYDGTVEFADLPVELEPVRQSLNHYIQEELPVKSIQLQQTINN